MLFADMLSRPYLPEVNASGFTRELDVDHWAGLSVTKERWQKLKHAAADDPVQ